MPRVRSGPDGHVHLADGGARRRCPPGRIPGGDLRPATTAVLDYIPTTPIPAPKRLVPEKYESPDTSELKATVKFGPQRRFRFDLK